MLLGRARVLLLLAALVVVVIGAACSPDEQSAYRSVNTLRDANHERWLDWNDDVYAKALAWSNHMADAGALSHSKLSDGVPAGWHTLGENVAYAGSIEQAMATLEASPPHRANLLNPAFRSIAIGVVRRGSTVWVTEEFIG
jgi:uncharacterized protein YkwD